MRKVLAALYPAIVMVLGLASSIGGFFLLLGDGSSTGMRVAGLVSIAVSLLIYSFSYRVGRILFGDLRPE